MKIIDFRKKGNVVRFYLGADDDTEYYGDDWDDRPYEHNAGTVYDEYIKGLLDVSFPFDWYVIEPSEDWSYRGNSPYCKDDFKARMAPCIVAVPPDAMQEGDLEYNMYDKEYSHWVTSDNVLKIYFGDNEEKIRKCDYYDELSLVWVA